MIWRTLVLNLTVYGSKLWAIQWNPFFLFSKNWCMFNWYKHIFLDLAAAAIKLQEFFFQKKVFQTWFSVSFWIHQTSKMIFRSVLTSGAQPRIHLKTNLPCPGLTMFFTPLFHFPRAVKRFQSQKRKNQWEASDYYD